MIDRASATAIWLVTAIAIGISQDAAAAAIGPQSGPGVKTSGIAPEVEEFGAVGDGFTDDSEPLERACNAGRRVLLGSGRTYRINRSIICVTDGGGLIGDNTATILMPASQFTNASGSADTRYSANSLGIDAHGQLASPFKPLKSFALAGFLLRSEVLDGRVLTGIAVRNAVDLQIAHVELAGFPGGAGMRLASIRGASFVTNSYIHGFTTNAVYSFVPQITGVEVDNDRYDEGTFGLLIEGNRIADITVGERTLARHGYQTDGIHIASQATRGVVVRNNHISNVGEGVDNYGTATVVSGNHITNAFYFGVKLTHGSVGAVISGNDIRGPGIAGVIIGGSNEAAVASNSVMNNEISDVDPNGVNSAGDATAGLIIVGYGATFTPDSNAVAENSFDCGLHGKYGVYISSSGGKGNTIVQNKVRNCAIAPYLIDPTIATLVSSDD